MHRHRQTDRRTDRQTDSYREMDGWINGWTWISELLIVKSLLPQASCSSFDRRSLFWSLDMSFLGPSIIPTCFLILCISKSIHDSAQVSGQLACRIRSWFEEDIAKMSSLSHEEYCQSLSSGTLGERKNMHTTPKSKISEGYSCHFFHMKEV